jgi:hypothetical protein
MLGEMVIITKLARIKKCALGRLRYATKTGEIFTSRASKDAFERPSVKGESDFVFSRSTNLSGIPNNVRGR